MHCVCFYSDYISECVETITVGGGFEEGVEYEYLLKDKFDDVYSGVLIGEVGGKVTINVSNFPEGFFNQYAGYFELRFKDYFVQATDPEGNVTMYEYIVFHVKGGNQNKNNLI